MLPHYPTFNSCLFLLLILLSQLQLRPLSQIPLLSILHQFKKNKKKTKHLPSNMNNLTTSTSCPPLFSVLHSSNLAYFQIIHSKCTFSQQCLKFLKLASCIQIVSPPSFSFNRFNSGLKIHTLSVREHICKPL